MHGVNTAVKLAGGGDEHGIGGNDDSVHPAAQYEGPNVDLPLKRSSFADDEGPLPQDFPFQAAVYHDLAAPEIQRAGHLDACADQA